MSDSSRGDLVTTILITDGEQRAALAAVRSLGRAGHRMLTCSHRAASLAGSSRYARASSRVPNPLDQPAAHAEAVAELAGKWEVEVLLPVTDASLLALLPIRDDLPALIPFGSLEDFRRISDKSVIAEMADRIGLAVPRSTRLDSPAQAVHVQGALDFPVVLKPARSVLTVNGTRAKHGVVHVGNRAALRTALDSLPADAYPVMLQERIEGDGVGVFILLHNDQLIAAFCHRRLREKPPSGGVSVYRESIPIDSALLERSIELLRHFEWEGPAMVEYKVDQATGTPYIMEINARFWGSLQLAIDAGVDFPVLLVEAALGTMPRPVVCYRHGVRSRWLLGDVDHLLLRMRKSAGELALTGRAPGRGRVLLDFLKAFGPRTRNEVFRWTDPMPALREGLDWIARK